MSNIIPFLPGLAPPTFAEDEHGRGSAGVSRRREPSPGPSNSVRPPHASTRHRLMWAFRNWLQRFLFIARHRYGRARAWQVMGTSLRAIRWFVGNRMLCVLADAYGELFQLLGPLLRDARLVGICKLHAPREMAFIVGRPSHSGETALQIIGGDRLVRGRPRVRRAFGCFICRSSVRDPSYRYADDDDEGSPERHASLRRFYRAQCIFGARIRRRQGSSPSKPTGAPPT